MKMKSNWQLLLRNCKQQMTMTLWLAGKNALGLGPAVLRALKRESLLRFSQVSGHFQLTPHLWTIFGFGFIGENSQVSKLFTKAN